MKQVISVIQSLVLEFFPRLCSDNPKFFKGIQLLALVAGLVVKVPEFLTSAGIDVPALIHAPYSNIIATCAAVVAIFAQLPNVTPAAPVAAPEAPAAV